MVFIAHDTTTTTEWKEEEKKNPMYELKSLKFLFWKREIVSQTIQLI